MAVAHTLLVMVFALLTQEVTYHELGGAVFRRTWPSGRAAPLGPASRGVRSCHVLTTDLHPRRLTRASSCYTSDQRSLPVSAQHCCAKADRVRLPVCASRQSVAPTPPTARRL